MGMVTLHLVIGVGVFLMPLFLLLFSTLAIPDFKYLYGKLAASIMAMLSGTFSMQCKGCHLMTTPILVSYCYIDYVLSRKFSWQFLYVPSFSSHQGVNVTPTWKLATQRFQKIPKIP